MAVQKCIEAPARFTGTNSQQMIGAVNSRQNVTNSIEQRFMPPVPLPDVVGCVSISLNQSTAQRGIRLRQETVHSLGQRQADRAPNHLDGWWRQFKQFERARHRRGDRMLTVYQGAIAIKDDKLRAFLSVHSANKHVRWQGATAAIVVNFRSFG